MNTSRMRTTRALVSMAGKANSGLATTLDADFLRTKSRSAAFGSLFSSTCRVTLERNNRLIFRVLGIVGVLAKDG